MASSVDSVLNGTDVAETGGTGATSLAPDALSIRDIIARMNKSLNVVSGTLDSLNEYSTLVTAAAPAMQDPKLQIRTLRKQIHAEEKKQNAAIEGVKCTIRDNLKDDVAVQMKAQIQLQIRSAIEQQVAQQVNARISAILPIPLADQARETRRRIEEVKRALENSEARRSNANLRSGDLYEPLGVVLMEDGRKSDVYPANLVSLFAYEAAPIDQLIKDYKLDIQEMQTREESLNAFMTHIGIQFRLVTLTTNGGPGPMTILSP
ncbi:hypothetical protein PLICRDRAFT_170325 [Plicaturopsis crispa FD-325 SS-3]|nr:hypothetical protein PLICRDRAFT_170325 [Plicaturopsis crispa FD-325 SS-3]